jgi:hypothetical protein
MPIASHFNFDLIGLPPSPSAVDKFVADRSADAYERVVDSLLASPRYGERWGRNWLDAAGYADSEGVLAADVIRANAWRYCDYVIRAFNSDKPYNHFVIEQLAGDEVSEYRTCGVSASFASAGLVFFPAFDAFLTMWALPFAIFRLLCAPFFGSDPFVDGTFFGATCAPGSATTAAFSVLLASTFVMLVSGNPFCARLAHDDSSLGRRRNAREWLDVPAFNCLGSA